MWFLIIYVVRFCYHCRVVFVFSCVVWFVLPFMSCGCCYHPCYLICTMPVSGWWRWTRRVSTRWLWMTTPRTSSAACWWPAASAWTQLATAWSPETPPSCPRSQACLLWSLCCLLHTPSTGEHTYFILHTLAFCVHIAYPWAVGNHWVGLSFLFASYSILFACLTHHEHHKK